MLPIRIKLVYGAIFLSCCLVLFATFIIAKAYKTTTNDALTLAKVENRIALDLNHLNLPDGFLKHSGSRDMVLNYITRLNAQLADSGVMVYSIEGISEYPARADLITKQLHAPQKSLTVSFVIASSLLDKNDIAVFILVCLFASTFTYLLFISERTKIQIAKNEPEVAVQIEEKPKLIVDLQNKTLAASCDVDKTVTLRINHCVFILL
ncbi:hypothetical protein [Pseudoalteromonas sp. GB43]